MLELKHSGMGVASFIIATLTAIAMFAVFVIAGYLETTTPGGVDEESAEAMLLGLFLFALVGLDLLAVGLGIGGLFQRDRRKIFAVLGTVFAGLTLLATGALMVIGLVAG